MLVRRHTRANREVSWRVEDDAEGRPRAAGDGAHAVAEADLVVAAGALLRAVVGREDARTRRAGRPRRARGSARAGAAPSARTRRPRSRRPAPRARSAPGTGRERRRRDPGAARSSRPRRSAGSAASGAPGPPRGSARAAPRARAGRRPRRRRAGPTSVRDRREVAVERARAARRSLRQRVVEVAVAAVAEAVARHVDRRAEAPAVEQVGERLAFGAVRSGARDRESARVELLAQVVPGERVDAPASVASVVVAVLMSSLPRCARAAV